MSTIKISAPISLRKIVNDCTTFHMDGNCLVFSYAEGKMCDDTSIVIGWDISINFMTNKVTCNYAYCSSLALADTIEIVSKSSTFELSAIDRARIFSVLRSDRREITNYVRDILNDDDDDEETIEMVIDNIRKFSRNFAWIC